MRRFISNSAILSLIGFLSLRALASAENWPGFRGPSRQGVSGETHLPLHWDTTNNVLWKTVIPRLGWSSPIVWGERVFVTTATDGGKSLRLLCLDAGNGAILWDNEVLEQDPARKDGGNSFATPTPVTDGERVYVVSFNGAFAAVTFDGAIAWTNLATKFYLKHGLAASPALQDNVLILPCDGTSTGADPYVGWQKPWDGSYMLALDKRTGKVLWKTMRGLSRVAFSSPNIAVVDGRPQVLSAAGDVVQSFDLQTGERLWSVPNFGEGPVPSVVVGEGLVFAASGWNTGRPEQPAAIRAFRLGGRPEGMRSHVWEQTRLVPKIPSFAYAKPYLFVVEEGGTVECLRAATGEVVWESRLSGRYEPSPVLAEGRLYFLSSSGKTTVIEAGPEFKKLAENPLGEKCGASMAVSGGRLFIRTEKNLFSIGGK
jgi:outer membrane protein assembly factor BamB